MEAIKNRILYEDNHLLIVNKPAGEIVQSDKSGDPSLLDYCIEYVRKKYNKPGKVFLGLVHRLDRPVSGCVILARTSKALSRMNEIFKNREIVKKYWAIVEAPPQNSIGRLEDYLWKNEYQNKSYVVDPQHEGARNAVLHYRLLSKSHGYYLLEITLESGRHHQIRVQLSSMGCIIKGDLKYGSPHSNPDKSISLHARSVEFSHPVRKETMKIMAPVPELESLWQILTPGVGEVQ